MASTGSNKAKIAKRVSVVLEFFDEQHPQATVMDIVRRFDRPQSSTSELLSSLVEVGLLYKDPSSRSYSPTPRAAMLGCAAQPSVVRDGRLTALIERLSAHTGLAVGVFGMVGLKVQVYTWRAGQRALRNASPFAITGGQKEHLSDSAAGKLLLSTIPQPRRDGTLRRLNAEAGEDRKFCFSEMAAALQQCHADGSIAGDAGFDTKAQIAAMLCPEQAQNQPLAIGFVFDPSEQINPAVLLQTLQDAVARCFDVSAPAAPVQPLFESQTFPSMATARTTIPTQILAGRHATMPGERAYS